MDFRVAIRTEQNTLVQFALDYFPFATMRSAQLEIFLLWVAVVEMQSHDRTLVATQATFPAQVLDRFLFQSEAPGVYRTRIALGFFVPFPLFIPVAPAAA